MPSEGVRYQVPLIPQRQENDCWFASLMMLFLYRMFRPLDGVVLPPLTMPASQLFAADSPVPISAMSNLVAPLGLHFTQWEWANGEKLLDLLRTVGPVAVGGTWADGNFGHMMVITGLSGGVLFINDPGPPGVGSRWEADYFSFQGYWVRPPYLVHPRFQPAA